MRTSPPPPIACLIRASVKTPITDAGTDPTASQSARLQSMCRFRPWLTLARVFVRAAHRLLQKHRHVLFLGPVCVQLDEEPVASADHTHAGAAPQKKAGEGGRLPAREVAVLETWPKTPFAAAPVEGQRSLDHEQSIFWGSCTDACRTSAAAP